MELRSQVNAAAALQALRSFPQALVAGVRPAVKAGLRDIQVGATQDHRFTSRSGDTDRSVTTDVDASGLSGSVRLDTGISAYGPLLHEGTGLYGPKGVAFTIEAKNKKALRWVFGGGFRFARKVKNPGIKADPFLYRSAKKHLNAFADRVNKAVARVLAAGGLK